DQPIPLVFFDASAEETFCTGQYLRFRKNKVPILGLEERKFGRTQSVNVLGKGIRLWGEATEVRDANRKKLLAGVLANNPSIDFVSNTQQASLSCNSTVELD